MASNYDDNRYDLSDPGFAERSAHSLRRVGHALTMIPIGGGFLAAAFSGSAALIETVSSLGQGKFTRAFKQAASGTLDTAVTGVLGASGMGQITWWANSFSALFTKSTLAEHARQLGNTALDGIDNLTRPSTAAQHNMQLVNQARINQVLSAQPQVNASVVAGPGYAQPMPQLAQSADIAQAQDTQFTDRVAANRGQTPEEARAAFMRDGDNRAHVQALMQSREQGLEQETART